MQSFSSLALCASLPSLIFSTVAHAHVWVPVGQSHLTGLVLPIRAAELLMTLPHLNLVSVPHPNCPLLNLFWRALWLHASEETQQIRSWCQVAQEACCLVQEILELERCTVESGVAGSWRHQRLHLLPT